MDALAGLLDGPRAQRAFLLRSVLRPPWSIRIEDEAPLTVVSVVRGSCWLRHDSAGELPLRPGAVAVLRGPVPYTVSDELTTPVQAVIRPGQVCLAPDGTPLATMGPLGVRSWGNDPSGSTMLLTGTYQLASAVGRRLLAALPDLVLLAAGDWDSPLVRLLADEIGKDAPGQDSVLDRLLDLLLIAVLRTWFERPGSAAPGWYRGYHDPLVGAALRLIHDQPAEAWTVDSLARAVGASRATLARRFTAAVGAAPMSYLTDWRLDLAADLLADPQATLGAVAAKVGYGTPFALSAAFKRQRGISPREHRAALASA